MFSRWYSLMIGFLLIVLGIAGLVLSGSLPGRNGGLVTISIVWLVTAVIALWFGFAVTNLGSVRWFALIVGAIYFVWGVIQLFAAPSAVGIATISALASVAGFNLLLGSIGLAAGLVPTTLMREVTAPMTP